jgi:hypothetical protein
MKAKGALAGAPFYFSNVDLGNVTASPKSARDRHTLKTLE